MDACPYSILGLAPSASPEKVKAAYRKLAMKHHPDKNAGNEDEASAKFRAVQAAYERIQHPGKSEVSLDELFAGMFGGGPVSRRVQTVRVHIPLQIFCKGGDVGVKYGHLSVCNGCAGAKGRNAPCGQCAGSRYHTWTLGPGLNLRTICPRCEGAGTEILEACDVCLGTGNEVIEKTVRVTVPAGCAHEHALCSRVSDDMDLRVRVLHDFPAHVVARGADLIWHERITIQEVLVGFRRKLFVHAGSSVVLRCAGALDPSAHFRTKLAVGNGGHLVIAWTVDWDMAPIKRARPLLAAAFRREAESPNQSPSPGRMRDRRRPPAGCVPAT